MASETQAEAEVKAEAEAAPSNRRRWQNVLIDSRFQLRFVLWFTLHGIVLGSFFCALITYLVRSTLAIIVAEGGFTEVQGMQILNASDQLIVKAIIATALFIAISGLVGLLFSHRTAGPLYNLKQCFGRVQSGDFSTRCNVRTQDELRHVAEAFNAMVETLEKNQKESG